MAGGKPFAACGAACRALVCRWCPVRFSACRAAPAGPAGPMLNWTSWLAQAKPANGSRRLLALHAARVPITTSPMSSAPPMGRLRRVGFSSSVVPCPDLFITTSPCWPRTWTGLSHAALDKHVDKPEQVREGLLKCLIQQAFGQTAEKLSSTGRCSAFSSSFALDHVDARPKSKQATGPMMSNCPGVRPLDIQAFKPSSL